MSHGQGEMFGMGVTATPSTPTSNPTLLGAAGSPEPTLEELEPEDPLRFSGLAVGVNPFGASGLNNAYASGTSAVCTVTLDAPLCVRLDSAKAKLEGLAFLAPLLWLFAYRNCVERTAAMAVPIYNLLIAAGLAAVGVFHRVPVKRIRPFNVSRTPDFGISLDIKEDHGVVELVVNHRRNAAGEYTFTVKWAGRTGARSTSPAELQTLMRNCKSMLTDYCKKKKIPWAHLLYQRRDGNKRNAERDE